MSAHPVMEELRRQRVKQGLSLEDLGEKAGYHGNHIWNLEHGKCRAKIDIVSDLAQALGGTVKIEWDEKQ